MARQAGTLIGAVVQILPEPEPAGTRVVETGTAGCTVIVCAPAIEPVTVSVAISVWLPAVLSVALNVCVPLSAAVKV